MNSKKAFLLVFFLLLAALPVVYAAENPISNILAPFADFDIGEIYGQYYMFLDTVFYILLFIFVARYALKGFYKENKSIATMIGIVLAISAAVFETRIGFKLGDLGPLALTVALIVVAITTFNLLKGLGLGGFNSAAWAIIIIYVFLFTVANKIVDELKASDNTYVQLLMSIAQIAFIFALITAIAGIFTGKHFRFSPGKAEEEARKIRGDEKREARDIGAETVEVRELEQLESMEINDLRNLLEYLSKINGIIGAHRRDSGALGEIASAVEAVKRDLKSADHLTRQIALHMKRLENFEREQIQEIEKHYKEERRLPANKGIVTKLGEIEQKEKQQVTQLLSEVRGGLERLQTQNIRNYNQYKKHIENGIKKLRKGDPGARSDFAEAMREIENSLNLLAQEEQWEQKISQQIQVVRQELKREISQEGVLQGRLPGF